MSEIDKKPLTINGCCDTIKITSGNTITMFGTHRFIVHINYCNNCGSVKSTSHIKEAKFD